MSITVDLSADLIEKLQPILRDLGTAEVDIRLADAGWDSWSTDSFMIWFADGSGRGVQWSSEAGPEVLVEAMDEIQDEIIDARWGAGLGTS